MPTRTPTYRPAATPHTGPRAIVVANHLRGSSSSRGYDWRWRQYSLFFLSDPVHAVCFCGAFTPHLPAGCRHPATCVDHIIPVTGPDDPLFWDPRNHHGLTQSCHSQKTHRYDPLVRALRFDLHIPSGRWEREEITLWRSYLTSLGLITA